VKLIIWLGCWLLLPGLTLRAQSVNCTLYPAGTPCRQACELYESPPPEPRQGSAASQQLFDRILTLCPDFAPAWHEKAVPYLKRGDFATWKQLIDEAVRRQPRQYLAYRGWCYFHFLRDYEQAAADLTQVVTEAQGQPRYNNDGDYDLRTVLALCRRELGDRTGALALLTDCIEAGEAQQRVGLYDYLHRGVTRLQAGDYAGAIRDLTREQRQVRQLAETHYYLGVAYQRQGQPALARQQLTLAQTLYAQGHYRHDSYSESVDAIYAGDIQLALAQLP
jgi:Flp pilus assembly protein TadD